MTTDTLSTPVEGPASPDEIRAVPVRHPGRWVAAAVIVVLVAMFAHSVAANPAYDGATISKYLTWPTILSGLWMTLWLTLIAMVVGVVGGVVLAVMRLSSNPLISSAGWGYVWFFRGTPLLVQILFWYNISALFPTVSIGVPFGPTFHTWPTNNLISAFTAVILALGLNEAAYMSEIVRAGIISVDEGQAEAAAALGMRRGLVMRLIVLPQALRVIVPPTGNELIGMLKTTSLVSVIGAVPELLQQAQHIYNQNYKTIPLLIVASFWYLVVTSILTVGQYYVERYVGRGSVRGLPPTPPEKLWAYVKRNSVPRHTSDVKLTGVTTAAAVTAQAGDAA
jgi:polar amino acid transport system permease protein